MQLSALIFISFVSSLDSINVCRNKCNDGGCEYTDKNGYTSCDCRFSKGFRTGTECESYVDVCKSKRKTFCKNKGTCLSTLGFPSCDCPASHFGPFCSISRENNEINPRNPSLYYRTKVRPGEFINTKLVIKYDEDFAFALHFYNNATRMFVVKKDITSLMSTNDFYLYCLKLIGNKDFPVNKNMCEYVKTAYDVNSKIMVLDILPYNIPKTRTGRQDYYFNGTKTEGRMGGRYGINVRIFDEKMTKEYLRYLFYHFVVDDESSYCLPFVDPGKNCENNHGLQVNRRNITTIEMIVTNDTELCNTSMDYIYEWIIQDGKLELSYMEEDYNVIHLDNVILTNRDLVIPPYTLPVGMWRLKFKLIIKNQDNGFNQYSLNRYECYVDLSLDKLHAEIVGNSVRQVSDSHLVTLDASLSFNPNEPNNKQDDVQYIWSCDVHDDIDNCQVYTTSNPIRILPAVLNKSKTYVFKLITRVNDYYVERVGKPDDGTTNVTLLPNSHVFDITTNCIKNCGHLSSPLEIVYLLVESNCDNCSFDWYYKEQSDSTFIPAKNIRELGTPPHVLIVLKRSLDYNKVYTFKAKDSNNNLEDSIVVRTAAKPVSGECLVTPNSGISGKTLFTITCSQFQNEYGDDNLYYYYYEPYEHNQDELGLLIDRSSYPTLKNIKLSTFGKLNVLAHNSFGIYAKVNIRIQVRKSSSAELVKMFKLMKIKLLDGKFPATVQIMSVISDILLDSKIVQGFSILFDTLSKIPSKGCMFRIEQNILALKKLVRICSVVNDHKIKPSDALVISINLLLISDNLFEHLRSLEHEDTIADVESIERIYNSLKIVMDILIRDINPIFKKNDCENSTRYFWSSLENLALVSQNMDETFKLFGESILLHHIIFEKHKIYESKEMTFWANMLNADMLKEQNDIIGYELANELLSDKNVTWGFKIFEIDKKLALWTESVRYVNNIESNVKYIALSTHNQTNGKYFRLVNKFNLPASITFKINETVNKFNDDEFTISVPAAGSDKIDFDRAIHVYRLDMEDIGTIFVTIKNCSSALLVRATWTRSRRPDIELMDDKDYVIKIPAGDEYNLTFQTHIDHQSDIHYIGIFADKAANRNSSYEVKFSMNVVSMRCVYWKNATWSSKGMKIGLNSSVGGNVHCVTYHFSMFRSSIFAPPHILNPIDEIHLFSTISNNMVSLVLVIVIFFIYFIILFWSRIQDKKDIFMGRIIILGDNYVGEDEVYLVTVYTGHGPGSGTTANVCLELNGTIHKSRAHWLYSPYYRTLQRSNDDWFLIFTPQSLGELKSIHIWHDSYGTAPDWYCQRIIILEIRTKKSWIFEVERWLSLCLVTESIEHIINTSDSKHNWKKETKEYVGTGLREKHLWASVFLGHPRSPITRCQKLSLILCTILSIMLTSMIFYETKYTDDEEFVSYELQIREFIIAMQSVLLETVLTFGVHLCFEQGRKVQLEKVTSIRPQKSQVEGNSHKSIMDKVFKIIIDKMTIKKIYYPVHTETIAERNQWNRWFIIGWTYCVIVYILTAFFIILYGLKFGRIKSLYWLTSLVIGILQSVIISKPLIIFLTSAILAKFNRQPKDQSMTYTYNIALQRYRIKTLMILQDIEYVRTIRKNRTRYLYVPITSKAIEILRERRILMANRSIIITDAVICMILILLSLCCLYFLDVFSSQNDKYYVNQITSKYLEHIFLSNDERISLNNLIKFISFKLMKQLHSLELYNGMPITNDTIETIEYKKRGWFGLYNSRLIGGGIRLRQKRINKNGETDNKHYGPGWMEYIATNDSTPWMYSNPFIEDYNETIADGAGYEIHLTGGFVECVSMLDEILKLRWLDTSTRTLYVEFKIYTPGTDFVTVVNVRMVTSCGLLYAMNTNTMVQTMPMSSVQMDWKTCVFTIFMSGSLMATVMTYVVVRVSRQRGHQPLVWTSLVQDGMLVSLALATVSALRRRLATMEWAMDDGARYVDLASACSARADCVSYAIALVAVALLKLSRPWWPDTVARIETPWVAAVIVATVFTRVSIVSSALVTLLFAVTALSLLFNDVIVKWRCNE